MRHGRGCLPSARMSSCRVHWRLSSPEPAALIQTRLVPLTSKVSWTAEQKGSGTWSTLYVLDGPNLPNLREYEGDEEYPCC